MSDVASTISFLHETLWLLAGPVLWDFGSSDVWRIQVQVLRSQDDSVAMDFKKSTQDESNMVAVAVRSLIKYLWQMTDKSVKYRALLLPKLPSPRSHWTISVGRTGSRELSLSSAWYPRSSRSTMQAISIASWSSLQADQIKASARNDGGERKNTRHQRRASSFGLSKDSELLEEFLPSAASVLTISAPNMLLSASLNAFLIGLGVYLGFVSTRNLDASAGPHDSRDIFITYVVSLGICYGIYSLSGVVVAHQIYISPRDLIRGEDEAPRDPSVGHHGIETPLGYDGLVPSRIPMQALHKGPAAPVSSTIPDAAQRSRRQGRDSQGIATHLELIMALRDVATLRRDTGAADERVAQLYERLSQAR